MVRPTGPGGVSDFFFQWSAQRGFVFQWSAQRAREGFRFSMVRPTGLRGRGRFFFQWFAQRVCGVGVGFFQWFAQRAREGFRFSMVRPTGLRGRGRFFSMVRPTGPGGVSLFNGPPNGPGRGSMVRPTGPGGVSFFNGSPNGWRGFGFFLSTGLPNVPGGFRFSMVRPTRLVCRGPQTLKGHLHGLAPQNAIPPGCTCMYGL